jgi:hypothetical protein
LSNSGEFLISSFVRPTRIVRSAMSMDEMTPAGDPLLQLLMDEVSAHVRDEEDDLFHALRQACTAEALDDLGDKIRQAKSLAPPHPAAPNTPPSNKALGPGAGLVDRARDLISGRGRS